MWGTGTKPPGRWIRPEALRQLTQDIAASVDPLFFVTAHLEAVLRDNIAAFLGAQEVDELIAEWSSTEEDAALVESVVPDTSARLRLTSILRALLGERVPLTRWQDILEVVGAHAEDDLLDVVRAVRLTLSDQLPGNDWAMRHVLVPERCEAGIASGAGSPQDPVPAEAAHDLLTFVRGEVAERDHETALIVRNAELRATIRRLVRAEFPFLAVLAENELVAYHEAKEAAAEALATEGASLDA